MRTNGGRQRGIVGERGKGFGPSLQIHGIGTEAGRIGFGALDNEREPVGPTQDMATAGFGDDLLRCQDCRQLS